MSEVAIVTGANRGIGLGWAKELLNRGYEVVATYRNASKMHELQKLKESFPDKLNLYQLDVRDLSKIEKFAKDIERVNLFICNAGVKGYDLQKKEFIQVGDLGWEEAYEVNARAPRKFAQTFFEHLANQKDALFVYISSGLSSTMHNASNGAYPYRPSKAYGNSIAWCFSQELMKAWEKKHPKELSSTPCSVAICPGWVRTEMGGENGRLSVAESVEGMMELIDYVKETKLSNGLYMHNNKVPYEIYDTPEVLQRVIEAVNSV